MQINLSFIGQLCLGLYLTLLGAIYFSEFELAAWVLPLLAIVAGIIILLGLIQPIVVKKGE